MASTLTIRRRISSVKNTKQITKAMELVSASKMRKAQDRAKLSRDYSETAYRLLSRLSSLTEVKANPLFVNRKVASHLYILVSSNSGLAGAYNSNVFRLLTKQLQQDAKNGSKASVITIGKQGAQFVRRIKDLELLAVYPAFGEKPDANDVRPILNTILDLYKEAKYDLVSLVYTEFKTNLLQIAKVLNILPASVDETTQTVQYEYDFTNFEPSVEDVLDSAATRLIEVQILQALLESLASEHSARMVAMKNATDNATELVDDLTLEYNSIRQASITQELAEISGGVEALSS